MSWIAGLQRGKAHGYDFAQQVGFDPRQALLDLLYIPHTRPQGD